MEVPLDPSIEAVAVGHKILFELVPATAAMQYWPFFLAEEFYLTIPLFRAA